MRRRAFLFSAGTVGLSGCLGTVNSGDTTTRPGGQPTTDRTTQPPMPTWTPTAVDGLTVGIDRIQIGVVGMSWPDSASMLNTGRRYVYLTVDTDENPPAADAFGLRFDGRTRAPRPSSSIGTHGLFRSQRGAYSAENPSGWLLFELPETGDASDTALTWPGGEWPLPERARRRLEHPVPTLSMSVSGSDSVRIGDGREEGLAVTKTEPMSFDPSVTLPITVTNEGDRPRRFLAVINQSIPYVTPLRIVTTLLAGGETETLTESVSLFDAASDSGTTDDDGPDATLTVSSGSDAVTVAVHLESDG